MERETKKDLGSGEEEREEKVIVERVISDTERVK